MMKMNIKTRRKCAYYIAICILSLLLFLPTFFVNEGGMYAMNRVTASAESGDYIAVEAYDVEMMVGSDRKVQVREKITVKFLRYGLTMFYRSLPTTGARYSDITASCAGNDEFSYYVANNPDMSGFIDVNCVGNADYNQTWTYDISYVMEQNVGGGTDDIRIDVIGFGWTVPLHNVTATVYLPSVPISKAVYTDVFGTQSGNEVQEIWSADGKSVNLSADCLDLVYNEEYGETVAGGITLDVTFEEGTLADYANTRMFTADMWKIVLGGLFAVMLAMLAFIVFRKKCDIITVVHVEPPKGMDPLKMGKWIDGSADNTDVTSMIYYFANKGYLKIDFLDEDDPELIALVDALPAGTPVYQKTLFNALFENARSYTEQPFAEAAERTVRKAKVSEIGVKFFNAMQTAVQQVPAPPMRYEKKSVLGYLCGGIIGALLMLLVPMLMSLRVGGGYTYFTGAIFILPVLLILGLGYIRKNYENKWKKPQRLGMWIAEIAIAVLFSFGALLFGFAEHIMTGYELAVLCAFAFIACFITQDSLSYSEKYLKVLGDILGFKDFIVVTEEDKIKVMLEENPELYYHILPYAQVLGVTNEWEGKFERLTIEPPSWYVGSDMTVFDYYIMNRCLTRSMMSAMARAASQAANSGGGHIGRSGGGGSFGGFGGGGFGGGGGGAR